MKAHKHAEIIKAWADGAKIECRANYSGNWVDCPGPSWQDHGEYRIKPEPDYPKTQMDYEELEEAYYVFGSKHNGLTSWDSEAAENLANAAIKRAIQDGDVILPNKE